MRHGDKVNNLGRTAAHRRALLANLAIALIEHKRITTTVAKAKALRQYVEPLVTKSKENTTNSRRVVFSYLQNKEAVHELFSTVATKIGERPGGYTRVIKLGFRRGDGAETALIEFVDFNEVYNANAGKVKTTKKTRRGRGGSAKTADNADDNIVAEDVATGRIVSADDMVSKVETIDTDLTRAEEPVASPVETIEAEPVVAATEAAPAPEATDAPAEDRKKEDDMAS